MAHYEVLVALLLGGLLGIIIAFITAKKGSNDSEGKE